MLEPADSLDTQEDRDTAGMEVQADTRATVPRLGTRDSAPSVGLADTAVVHLVIQGLVPSAVILGTAQPATAGIPDLAVYLVTVVFQVCLATADSPERAGTADSRDLADTQVILPLIQDTLVTPVPVDTRATRQRVPARRDSAGFLDLYQERADSLDLVGKAGTQDFLLLRDIQDSRQEAGTADTPDLVAKAEAGTQVTAGRVATAGILHSQDSLEPQEKAGIRVIPEGVGTLDSVGFAVYRVTRGSRQQTQDHRVILVIQEQQVQ